MINKVQTPPNITLNSSTNNKKNIERIKRDLLQRKSNEKFQNDVKYNKVETYFFGGAGAIATIATMFMEEHKKEMGFNAIVLWLLAATAFIFKPQKEKYDAQVEIDLKKEMENDNTSNK